MTYATYAALLGAGAALAVAVIWIVTRTVTPIGTATTPALLVDALFLAGLAVVVFLVVRSGDPEHGSGRRASGSTHEGPKDDPRARRRERSQRLEALGEFTGAVAHDFNNLLTAIITPIQLLLADLPADHPLRPRLEEVEDAATRGAALSRQLLAFGRKQVAQQRPHDLNEILAGLRPLLQRLLGPSITLQIRADPDLRTVVVDPGQFEQVIVNLVVNARDAMPDGGLLRVSTSNVDPEKDRIRTGGPAPTGGYVTLEVADTGHGFDEDVRQHLFDPYFSTKEHGTGLGLATVFGIVCQCGGFVRAEGAPGGGASFRVFLPAVEAAAEPLKPRRSSATGVARGGSELVLVVEDEEPVRMVLVRALTRFGYRVVQASSAEEALDYAAELDSRVDLLLTDVRLPGRSGPELAEELSTRCPGLGVIYVSGFSDQGVLDGANAGDHWIFLPKPFSVEDLLSVVRQVLDRGGRLDHAG